MSAPTAADLELPNLVKPVRALLSVSDKTGLVDFARFLSDRGVELLSTGGSAKALADAGLSVLDVSSYTGFPEMMDGRVKTLHPKVHGGILALRDLDNHARAMADHDIGPIDMVIVNLYPFTQTVASGASAPNCVENVDIGGPAMIRAAAKNHGYVSVIVDPAQYPVVMAAMTGHEGQIPFRLRRHLAGAAYSHTAAYDTAIATWFAGPYTAAVGEEADDFMPTLLVAGEKNADLRYGENPHQKATVYLDGSLRRGVARATQLQGKALSYNNLGDTDAAFELVAEFDPADGPACAIIKHGNPCGVGVSDNQVAAYQKALSCDPVSAFGGILAFNTPVLEETAQAIVGLFTEVIIAPAVSEGARVVLAQKKNLRVLTTDGLPDPATPGMMLRSIAGGYLMQSRDNGRVGPEVLKVVTKRAPTDQELTDLLFAFRVCKHVKSNAIIYTKGLRTVGIGAGQMSRIDSSRIAAWKAGEAVAKATDEAVKDALGCAGSVVASDAFFPFADGLLAAADAGATAIIQPGGSLRDDEVIAAADERGLAMVFTGMRHFRH